MARKRSKRFAFALGSSFTMQTSSENYTKNAPASLSLRAVRTNQISQASGAAQSSAQSLIVKPPVSLSHMLSHTEGRLDNNVPGLKT